MQKSVLHKDPLMESNYCHFWLNLLLCFDSGLPKWFVSSIFMMMTAVMLTMVLPHHYL
jgi:hypothetical protein